MSSPLELHVWQLQQVEGIVYSLDPNCLATLLALQLLLPGQFSIVTDTTPDNSPSGTLPYLKHGHKTVSGFADVLSYVAGSGLGSDLDLDAHLNKAEKARHVAWIAHIENQVGLLVAHQVYAAPENWAKFTHPALVTNLSIPYRYYVPNRVREVQKGKLAAAGLWDVAEEKVESEPKTFAERQIKARQTLADHNFSQTFAKQKVLDKARAIFETYASIIQSRLSVSRDRLTTFDVLLAAHVLVLSQLPYPDPILKNLLTEQYPQLIEHANNVRRLAYEQGSPPPPSTPQALAPTSLIPWTRWKAVASPPEQSDEWKKLQRSFALQRWGWIAAATIGAVGYFWTYGLPLTIRLGDGRNSDEDDEPHEHVHD